MMLDTDAVDTDQSLGQQSRLLKVRCVTLLQEAHMDSYGWGGCEMTDTAPPLWIADQKSATSLRHGRIQQVLGVACPCHPVDTAMR